VQERLQKFLARGGIASRRRAEELITAGRVTVNSACVRELGTRVDPARDLVAVDGVLVSPPEGEHYYLLYKPPGCVTTLSDPEGRRTAADYLRVKERVFPVGRLDYDAEGAVLFTTDGALAHRLAHPRYGHERTYLVKVKGSPQEEQLARLRTGVRLDDGPARALEAALRERAEKNTWIRLVVGEGRFHLVKRLCQAVGLEVLRLFRPEFGGISVAGLGQGQVRELSRDEVITLKRAIPSPGAERASARPRPALPRAARRHGHGPPAPPGAKPEEAERPAKRRPGPPDASRRTKLKGSGRPPPSSAGPGGGRRR
jgi:23S rRNA pseudouridine2605 synthase